MEKYELEIDNLIVKNFGINSVKDTLQKQITCFPNCFDVRESQKILKKIESVNNKITERIFARLDLDVRTAAHKAHKKFNNVPLEIDDFISESWFSLKEALVKYNPKKSDRGFQKYYLSIVYWRSIDYIRKFLTNKYKAVNNALIKPVNTDTYDYNFIELIQHDPWVYNDLVQFVRDNIKTLKGRDKQLLKYFLSGYTVIEIAVKMGCTERTAKRLLNLALVKLKRKLA